MKYIIRILVFTFVGWPVMVISYLWHAAEAGWIMGAFIYEEHEAAAIKKFLKEQPCDK